VHQALRFPWPLLTSAFEDSSGTHRGAARGLAFAVLANKTRATISDVTIGIRAAEVELSSQREVRGLQQNIHRRHSAQYNNQHIELEVFMTQAPMQDLTFFRICAIGRTCRLRGNRRLVCRSASAEEQCISSGCAATCVNYIQARTRACASVRRMAHQCATLRCNHWPQHSHLCRAAPGTPPSGFSERFQLDSENVCLQVEIHKFCACVVGPLAACHLLARGT
jgi:hypothetical protein